LPNLRRHRSGGTPDKDRGGDVGGNDGGGGGDDDGGSGCSDNDGGGGGGDDGGEDTGGNNGGDVVFSRGQLYVHLLKLYVFLVVNPYWGGVLKLYHKIVQIIVQKPLKSYLVFEEVFARFVV
jgi:hypothetical protein